jgi:hypothetical protein
MSLSSWLTVAGLAMTFLISLIASRGDWKELNQSNRKHRLYILGLQSLGLVIALVGVYLSSVESAKQTRRIVTSGVLTSAQSEIPPMFISVGKFKFTLASSANGVLFSDGAEPLLSIRTAGGRMLISTRILNERGELTAELRDNEWSVASRPGMFDRNYTDEALEVRDSRGKVALQTVAFGGAVHVAALLRCKSGRGVLIAPFKDGALMQAVPPGAEPFYSIPPICDYPSDVHFGSCPGVSVLKKQIEAAPGWGGSLLTRPLDVCNP